MARRTWNQIGIPPPLILSIKPSTLNHMFSNRKGLFPPIMHPHSNKIGKWLDNSCRSLRRFTNPKWPAQSGESKNLSILDFAATSRLLDQVKRPPSNGMSIKPKSNMKSEKACIAAVISDTPDFSVGNLTTLNSPSIYQGASHQLTKPPNSTQKEPLSLSWWGP